MRKNAILILLLIAAVVAILVVGIPAYQQKRALIAGEQTSTGEKENLKKTAPSSEITIEGAVEELKRIDDVKLDLADPGLEFDVSY